MILVGVDGSRAGLEAVSWAAQSADLRVVHARADQGGLDPADPGGEHDGLSALKETLSVLRARQADVLIVEGFVHGHPAEVLRQAATGADLLVMGSHGHGTFAGMVLGSVSHTLLHHAPCPLAVVRTAR